MRLASSLGFRGAAFALVWWAISEGQGGAWWFGAPAALAAAALSIALAPPPLARVRPLGLLAFLPYFARESIRGGIDVVGRAVHPALPLSPAVLDYPLALTGRAPRIFFAIAASLLPGTLAVRLHAGGCRLHVLDDRLDIHAALAALERRTASVFARGDGEDGG